MDAARPGQALGDEGMALCTCKHLCVHACVYTCVQTHASKKRSRVLMIPSYSCTHTGWSSHHDHCRDSGGPWACLRSQPRRQSGSFYLTWQVEVFVINLFSFSVSQGLGAIPGILCYIHSPPPCPCLCVSCGEAGAFLCSPGTSLSILSWWDGVMLILVEDWMDSLGHWEYSSKASGSIEVPQTLEGHN